jgi:hypothetical protein
MEEFNKNDNALADSNAAGFDEVEQLSMRKWII